MKKKIIVNTIVLVVFFSLCFSAFLWIDAHQKKDKRSVNNDNWSQIVKSKKIVVGLDDTFVPFGFRNKQGKIVGFDVDLANAVFKLYGISVKWQPIDWSMKETELNGGDIDAIWNGYTITPQREQKVLFSDSYRTTHQIVVTMKDSGITDLQKMTNKVLAVQNSSTGEDDLNRSPKLLKDKIKDHKGVGYDTFDKAFDDLNAKRVDGILIDSEYAYYYIAHQSDPSIYQVLKTPFPEEKFAAGFRKSDRELVKKVNEGLKILKKNGKLEQLTKKWFGNNS